MSKVAVLPELAKRINEAHQRAEGAVNDALHYAREAGVRLLEAKGQVEHGGWLQWVELNCAFSDRTARQYMQIARQWPELEAKRHGRANLGVEDARLLLAEPRDRKPRAPKPANSKPARPARATSEPEPVEVEATAEPAPEPAPAPKSVPAQAPPADFGEELDEAVARIAELEQELATLRSRLNDANAFIKDVINSLGVQTAEQVIGRIAALVRRDEPPKVMIRDGETIQEYEKRRRKAEQNAMPSAMF